jgi:hypothetical protein
VSYRVVTPLPLALADEFSARFGFTDRVRRSRLMRRTADPALTGDG